MTVFSLSASARKAICCARRSCMRHRLSIRCAPVEVRSFTKDCAVRGGVDHLTVEHSSILERQMQHFTIFGLERMLELHHTDFSATADLNLILNRAEIARTTLYGRSSADRGHAL